MKKSLLYIFGIVILLSWLPAYATSYFSSQQLAPTPVSTYVLQTNGVTSTWVSPASLGIVGGNASQTNLYAGNSFINITQVGTNATLTPASVLSLQSTSSNGGITFSSATGTNITAVLSSLNNSQFVNNSGYLTGNQTISLTGPVTGSGATTIATTIVSPLVISAINATTITATTSITDAGTLSAGTSTLGNTTVSGNATTTGNHNITGTLTVGSTASLLTTASVGTSTQSGALNVNGQITTGNGLSPYDATSTTPTTTISFSTWERQKIVLGAATTTLYLSNFTIWGNDQLTVCQDGTGSRTVTWAVSSTNAAATIDWGTAGTPTLSTAANKCDIFSFSAQPTDTKQASTTVYGEYGSNGFSS